MSKSVKFTRRKRVTVIDGDGGAPFWLEHIGLFIVAGLAVVVGGMILLTLTDWGRAAMVWGGLGFGVLMAAWLAIDPWRSLRTGEPLSVWVGEAIAALGWGRAHRFAGGRDPVCLLAWAGALPGVGVRASGRGSGGVHRDRNPRDVAADQAAATGAGSEAAGSNGDPQHGRRGRRAVHLRLNRPGLRSDRYSCPAVAGRCDSWSA